jgi:polyferredoxin
MRRFLAFLLSADPDQSVDLFARFPKLKRFFAERRLHALVRSLGDVVFAAIVVSGLFGPVAARANAALFLAWGVWWPSVVLSWFFLGRMWCGFCPFPGLGRLLRSRGLGLDLPVPRLLERWGVHMSALLFAVIIWLEESTALKESPRATAWLLLAILAGATGAALLFRTQAWCRYLCPMGRIVGVASTLSLTEFRPDHAKCRTCTDYTCRHGTDQESGCPVDLGAYMVRNNLYCLVCGRCVKLCPHDAPSLRLRSPFKELVVNKGRYITCSWIIPFLLGSLLARFLQQSGLGTDRACEALGTPCALTVFLSMLVAGTLAAYVATRVGGQVFGVTHDEMLGRFSPFVPVFLPLAFSGELAYRLDYFVRELPHFLPTLGRQFGVEGLPVLPLPLWLSPSLNGVVLGLGGLAGMYVVHQFAVHDFREQVGPGRYVLSQALVLAALAALAWAAPFW